MGKYPIKVSGLTNSNYTINYKPGTLTVKPGSIIVSVRGKTISYGDPVPTSYDLTCNNPDIKISDLGTPHFECAYTNTSPVGEYPITVTGLTLANYTIEYTTGAKLYVRQREVTVSWGNTTFTYNGKEQKPVPSFNNVANNDDLKATVSVNIESKNVGDKYATVTISNSNYKLSGETSTKFKIIPLKIAFDGIIEHDYADGGIKLDGNLFEGKFKIAETIEDASSVGLSSAHADIVGGTAKNFSGSEVTTKPENGFYSYAFGSQITAGSTYLISDITLKDTSNFELTTTKVYLKYKTAKIGNEYFTIEDALAASGNITLCGNASTASASSYVITAFAKLNNLSGTDFKDYKANYEYTLKSNSTLLLPYNKDGLAINSDSDMLKCASEPAYVYSVLAISQGIKFTISGTLDIGGRLSSKGGNLEQARVKQHSVVYNNGNIVVTNRINSYGYLKGANGGLVELQSTATALDIMLVYDWLAGTEAIQIHNAGIFPFKSYSIHNISCKTKIIKGAQYLAKAALNVQDMLLPSKPIPVVGTSDSMFTVESGYIVKTASNADSNKASTDLTSITGTNQLKGQKDIITLGENTVCHDNSITLNVQGKKITTSKDYPLPISYINLVVPNTATLNLNAVSYLFYPGSSLKVEAGGKLEVEKVSVAFYTLNDCISDENWEKNRVKYATAEGTNDYAVDRTDAKLAIDAGGTATIKSNASISGCITATNAQAQLIINSSTSVSVKVPTDLIAHNVASTWDKGQIALGLIKASITTKTYTAFGDIMAKQNNYSQQDFSTGTYYSVNIGSDSAPVYAWFKNSATITYNPKGGTLNGSTTDTVTLPSGGYTDLPTPTRKYYSFDGWYFDDALTQKATAIYTDCTLIAKWTPIQYTIVYNLPYDECGTLANGSLSGTEVKTLDNPPQTITVNGNEYTFGGWYLNSDRTGDPITAVSAADADNSKFINVYALFYRVGTYTVNYEENPEGIEFTSKIKDEDKPTSQVFDKGVSVSELELRSLKKYNENTSFDYYFEGWYLSTDSNKTIIKSLPKTIDGDITLCAKWIKKAQLKIELPVFENGNRTGNTIVYDTHKYFYKQTIKEIGINNLSSYIGAVYTVPENYKFIGFNASSGFTAKQNYSNMNDITTTIEVGETSNDLTITADIRKILRVDITMTASAAYTHNFGTKWTPNKKTGTGDFSINKILIGSNAMYSINNGDWLISNGTTDLKQKTTGTQTFYVLEGNTDIEIAVDNIDVTAKLTSIITSSHTFTASDIPQFETTGCTKPANNSPFTFTITNSDATINWSGQATYSD